MNQMLLPTHEPSDADLIEIALSRPLQEKIDRAILMFREYERAALRLSDEGYYLAFSGGKDSIVIKQLAIEAGVAFAPWYNLTTIDPPELVKYIKRHHAEVRWSGKDKGNLCNRSVEFQTMPQRRFRWCCQEYKESGGDGLLKVIGVRIAESARRAGLWREFRPHRTNGGAYLAPICYWTDEDVWAFIRSRNLPYCELYDEGFKRLGCVGCPLAGQNQRDEQFARWPKYEAMWKRAVFKLYKWAQDNPKRKNGGIRSILQNYESADALWDWWRSGKASEGAAECFQQEMDLQR